MARIEERGKVRGSTNAEVTVAVRVAVAAALGSATPGGPVGKFVYEPYPKKEGVWLGNGGCLLA